MTNDEKDFCTKMYAKAHSEASHKDCYGNFYKLFRNTWYWWTGEEWRMCHFTPKHLQIHQ